MTEEQFWSLVDACRSQAGDISSFNASFEQALSSLSGDELRSCHNWIWQYMHRLQWRTGMQFHDELSDCVYKAMGLQLGGDTGDCYAGWAIAQGREVYERLLREPTSAADRLPTWQDVWEGENVIFLPARVFRERTGGELLDDDTSG